MDPSILSSLPTDSLYKFLALTGVTLAIVSAIGPEYVKRGFMETLYDLIKKLRIEEVKQGHLQRETSEFGERVAELRKDYERVSSEEKDEQNEGAAERSDSIKSTVGELEAVCQTLRRKTDELGLMSVELSCDADRVEIYSKQILKIKRLQIAGIVLGFSIGLAGFGLWYYKLQIHIDRLATTQANSVACEQGQHENHNKTSL